MKKITLTKNKKAIVDDDSFYELSQLKWLCDSGGYASRCIWVSKSKVDRWYMHWSIIGKPPKGYHVDHINGNRLDNRKENLMIVNYSQSQINRKIGTNNKSGYKGVHKNNKSNKWFANIRIDGKIKYLGGFGDIKEAVRVRDNAVKKYYGDFMRK